MNNDTLTNDHIEISSSESNDTTQDRLAKISALIAAKREELNQTEVSKSELAPFTCPIDPAERATCDSCQ